MENLEQIIRKHPFFADMPAAVMCVVAECARNVRFEARQCLCHEGHAADQFFLLRHGRVALEVSAPGRGTITFKTLREGDLVGVSWLVPPYRWSHDARALALVGAVAIDAACLRGKCEADHDLGYDMMKRFMPALIAQLQSAQMQLLDVYGAYA